MKKYILFSAISISLLLVILSYNFVKAQSEQITLCIKNSGLVFVMSERSKKAECTRNDQTLVFNKTGEQGPKGDKGENGDIGPQGPKGDDGKSLSRGSGNIAFIFNDNLLKTDGSVWWLMFENGSPKYYKRLGDGSDGVGNIPVPISDIVDWQYNSLLDIRGDYWYISLSNVKAGWKNYGQLP